MTRPIAAALLLALPACATLPVAPVAVADKTVLDEKIGIAATVGYTAASTLGNRLSLLGVIPRAQFQALDQRGYDAVIAIRAAYLTGNAVSYLAAIEQAKAATAAIGGLVK
jgi:hypothetical protein